MRCVPAARTDLGGNEAFWRHEGRRVLTVYLLAAAFAGETIMRVMSWTGRHGEQTPVDLVRHQPTVELRA